MLWLPLSSIHPRFTAYMTTDTVTPSIPESIRHCPGRPSFDRPGADDPDVDRRLRVRHPVGATALPGGSSQPRVSVVLRLGLGRSDPRSLRLLTCTQRALSRQRYLSLRLR